MNMDMVIRSLFIVLNWAVYLYLLPIKVAFVFGAISTVLLLVRDDHE